MIIKSIAVFGTGLMGKGIIQVLAVKGNKVLVFSNSEDAQKRVMEYLKNEVDKGRLQPESLDIVLENAKFYNYSQLYMLASVDLIIETTFEDKEAKKRLLSSLNKVCNKNAILATNTSTFSIADLASVVKNPELFCGLHFFSPVPQMQLVEVVKGLNTSDEVLATVCNIVRDIDKVPLIVKDTPGFIVNRVTCIMLAEAIRMVEEGISTPYDIDKAITLGLSLKVGPLRLADAIGLDVIKSGIDSMYNQLKDSKYKPIPLLNNMVGSGMLGKKTGKGFYSY